MNVNQKQFAVIIGLTPRRIRELKNEEGLFQLEERGKGYNLERCVPEYIEYKLKAEVKRGTSFIKEKEQAEHENIKKNISKLKLRRLKHELHEAADVEFFLTEMLVSFRNKLLAIPTKVAGLLLGEKDVNKMIGLLEKEMFETLDELSEYDPIKINHDPLDYDIDDEEEE